MAKFPDDLIKYRETISFFNSNSGRGQGVVLRNYKKGSYEVHFRILGRVGQAVRNAIHTSLSKSRFADTDPVVCFYAADSASDYTSQRPIGNVHSEIPTIERLSVRKQEQPRSFLPASSEIR